MSSMFEPPTAPLIEPPYGPPTGVPTAPTMAGPVTTGPSTVVMPAAVLPSRRSTLVRNVAIGVAACAVVAFGAFGIGRATGDDGNGAAAGASSPNATSVTSVRPATGSGAALDVDSIVASISPSVVKVSVDVDDAGGGGEGVGTGIVLTADGQILTNAHVVVDAKTVRVVLFGATDPVSAKVLGIDVGNDLALLQVDATDLPVMPLGDSDAVRVGDPVVAMGYALDLEGDPSVTSGIISALGRSMVTEAGALNGLLQTDAAISSGNSGGPLVDAAGELIGINTAVARSDSTNAANNIGFSISTKEIERVLVHLRSTTNSTTRDEGYLGIGVEDRHDGGRGANVSEVQDGSPADGLGLRVGDVITAIDGVPIEGQAGLIAAIRDSDPGATLTIQYSHDGASKSGTVTLDTRPTGG